MRGRSVRWGSSDRAGAGTACPRVLRPRPRITAGPFHDRTCVLKTTCSNQCGDPIFDPPGERGAVASGRAPNTLRVRTFDLLPQAGLLQICMEAQDSAIPRLLTSPLTTG